MLRIYYKIILYSSIEISSGLGLDTLKALNIFVVDI